MFHVPEKSRVTAGKMGSDASYGNNGAFVLRSVKFKRPITVVCSDGMGWEHVSVTVGNVPDRCPTWEEMCFVKSQFWDAEDVVIQIHPPHSLYVNNHKYCLHMWRKIGVHVPLPPSIMVGVL